MSLKLFSLFTRTLKHNLPRHPVRPGLQFRYITAMDTAVEKPVEVTPEIVANKSLTRFKKRFYQKRQWDDPDRVRQNGESDPKKPFERLKRKKMAMILGYSGVNYHGMQRNPGVPTIEEELLKALLDAKYITEEDFTNQQSAQFQRSSRTDKGVSAARQIVSLKLPLEVSVNEINKRLPECIRVFGVKRVTNRFNSKSKCNARTYSYTLPTFVFEPSLIEEEERKNYRITEEKLQKVNDVLGVYKGTKGYHNFTEKKHYQDPSALRFMMGFSIEKVFVTNDMEFAVLLVKGQSFMLHQIRKMVGLMIAVLRGLADTSTVDKAFGKEKVMIPTSPGLGLVLDKVHYERYDAKFKDSHDSLTWDDEEEAIQKFKHEHIYPDIVKGELEGSMALWLEKLGRHSFEPSEDNQEDRTEEQAGGGDDDDDDDDDADKRDAMKGDKARDVIKESDGAKDPMEGIDVQTDVRIDRHAAILKSDKGECNLVKESDGAKDPMEGTDVQTDVRIDRHAAILKSDKGECNVVKESDGAKDPMEGTDVQTDVRIDRHAAILKSDKGECNVVKESDGAKDPVESIDVQTDVKI